MDCGVRFYYPKYIYLASIALIQALVWLMRQHNQHGKEAVFGVP